MFWAKMQNWSKFPNLKSLSVPKVNAATVMGGIRVEWFVGPQTLLHLPKELPHKIFSHEIILFMVI